MPSRPSRKFLKLRKKFLMNKFILASGNPHKVEELCRLLSPTLTIKFPPKSLEVIEDGNSFEANALKKALAYFKHFQYSALADDSGIVVEALPTELGIYSARFGGEGASDEERGRRLLEKLEGQFNRKAYFICSLCFYLSPQEIFFFEGRLNGTIAHHYSGDHGFGYDPVFIPDGVENEWTLAECPEWKDQNSHRAKACDAAKYFFKSMIKNDGI